VEESDNFIPSCGNPHTRIDARVGLLCLPPSIPSPFAAGDRGDRRGDLSFPDESWKSDSVPAVRIASHRRCMPETASFTGDPPMTHRAIVSYGFQELRVAEK